MYEIDPQSVIEHVARLDFTRVVGTEGEQRGFDVVREELAAFGVEAWFEEFSSPWVEIAEAYLQVSHRQLPLVPAASPLFNGRWIPVPEEVDLSGTLVADAGPEPEAATPIVLRTALDAEDPCACGAAAQVFACRPEESFQAHYLAAVGMLDRAVPSAYVEPEAEALLSELVGSECRFLWTCRHTEKMLRNLVAEVRGAERPGEVIVVGAHLDSFPGTVGASDNASGCARLVEFARWFVAHPPVRTLRFVWFTGEELDRRGSRAYAEAHRGDKDRIYLFVNVDGGVSIGHEPPQIDVSDEDAVAKATERSVADIAPGDSGVVFRQSKTHSDGSDAAPFQAVGIPAAFAPGGGKRKSPGPYPHLPSDTVATIDPEGMRVASVLGLAFIDAVQKYQPAT